MNDLSQTPAPGLHALHHRGDSITFVLTNRTGHTGSAWLRTNIGHGAVRLREIILHAEQGLPTLARDWHDLPMTPQNDTSFAITLPLLDVGRFEAKAYFVADDDHRIQWPEGGNSVLKVEPAETCAANTIYTAFVRLFGEARFHGAVAPQHEPAIRELDEAGYAVLPRSGTFRDLVRQLDFIVGTLRCRIVQLLPIHPTPTTYARMGRFGSPFAVMDLLDVDPALAEFDQHTTPLDQFQELVDEIHRRNARIYLDMPINHTGWASHLQINHPEWFHHNEDGSFMSPGAWGVVWEDLAKLDYAHRDLWRYMAEVFLFWCRRGVDGFRCDAGYKIPFEAWQYIIAKVRTEYPDTLFLLEGLGGHKHVTERLLADAGMNWAYSEIFQNFDRAAIDAYLPESIRVSASKGSLIHFCETHDNRRLAATSPAFARLRAAFCALTAPNGAFGFANGVEWYATEQINVHNAHSLAWNTEPNMIDWLRRLHALLEIHPAFHAGAAVELITTGGGNVSAVQRTDAANHPRLLILANHRLDAPETVAWNGDFAAFGTNLLDGETYDPSFGSLTLPPATIYCLSNEPAWLEAIETTLQTPFQGAPRSEQQLLQAKTLDLFAYFNRLEAADTARFVEDPKTCCIELANGAPIVTTWQGPQDAHRTVLLPPDHLLLVRSDVAFLAKLADAAGRTCAHERSIPQPDGRHFALFLPLQTPNEHQSLTLHITRFAPNEIQHLHAPLLQLCQLADATVASCFDAGEICDRDRYAICTNQHGALAQVRVAWADLRSKYDGLLAANLNPHVPVDRHTLFSRCRAWVVRRGYSTELALQCQTRFGTHPDGSIAWDFTVPVGEGLLVPLTATLRMHPNANSIELRFERTPADPARDALADDIPVELILRPDLEDRCNHETTKAFAGPEHSFPAAVRPGEHGFVFTPDPHRRLALHLENGTFFVEPEWNYMIDHPVDRDRCIDGQTDLFSPGYFKTELRGGTTAVLMAGIDPLPKFTPTKPAPDPDPIPLAEAMRQALDAFIVQRDEFKTVIAGYPWFLDWGRDTLIALRGIIAAGQLEEAERILVQFARFERGGTLPNMIRGNDDANRETSDAPLWFFVACDELMNAQGHRGLLETACGPHKTLQDALVSLAHGLLRGTENGITVDPESGLVFSPAHFTWMDTNYPAGTPRQGYPIEIQALWHYALAMLASIDPVAGWNEKADQVRRSIHDRFVVESDGLTYLADLLAAAPGTRAQDAEPDDALRCNQLLAITLGAIDDPALARTILEACEQLLVPGAIRTLADRPVRRPAPIHHNDHLLNDPLHPYWGHYTGDEDTRRKPAYHNGSAWSWVFPSYAEALFLTYGEPARIPAQNLLGSASYLANHGCIGHLPELVDGNTPHAQRGCGAQAWSASELFRVLHRLDPK